MYYLLAIAAAVAGLFLYMIKEGHGNKVIAKHVFLPEFPGDSPFTIFFISDIHRRNVSPSIIAKAKGKADVVIIGGDLAERGVKFEKIKENLTLMKEIAPVFFIWGNNDYELPKEKLSELFAEEGIYALRNESVSIPLKTGGHLYLLGIDDVSTRNCDKEAMMAGVPQEACKILLSHNPAFARKITPDDNISLCLSGHTHGGQIRLLSLGLYKLGGWESHGKMKVLVSNGYGTSALPLRLGAKAETHLLTISKN